MKNLLRSVALALAIAVVPSGCAALLSNLPAILAGIQDAEIVLANVETGSSAWFASNPNPARQKEVNLAIAKARTALDAALNAANGTTDANKAEVDAAFVAFRAAYEDVLALVGPLGIRAAPGGMMRAAPGEMIVPTSADLLARMARR